MTTDGPHRQPKAPAPAERLMQSRRGGVLVETALALPVLVTLLLSIITYGAWFMAAHSLQQAANDAARAALAGLDTTERRALVEASVARSVSKDGTLSAPLVSVRTAQDGNYLTVRLDYALERSPLFSATLLPLPRGVISRSAVIEIPAL